MRATGPGPEDAPAPIVVSRLGAEVEVEVRRGASAAAFAETVAREIPGPAVLIDYFLTTDDPRRTTVALVFATVPIVEP